MAELSLKFRLGVGVALLVAAPVLCLEKTTGQARTLDERFTAGEPDGAVLVEHGAGDAPALPFADLAPEDAIVLSGMVVSELGEPIDVDLMVPDSTVEGGWAPQGKILMDAPGELALMVPKDMGVLVIQAFQDLDGNGPSASDPFVGLQLTIEGEDLVVDFTLVEGAYAEFTLQGASSATAFPDHEGEWTLLSGTVSSALEGTIAVDFLGPDPKAPSGTAFLTKTQLDPGAYELAVPRGLGPLTLQFFQDQTGDGPDATDPFAQIELVIGDQEALVHDVTLEAGSWSAPAQGGGGSAGPGDVLFEDLGPSPVTLSGELILDGVEATQVAVDVYRVDAGGHGGRSFLKKVYITPGSFSFQAPAGYGELLFEATIDPDGDGPTPGDPFGSCGQNPVRIGDKDITDLTITVSG